MPEAQRQVVVAKHRVRPVEVAAHLRPHQFELRDRLRQARPRVLLLETEQKDETVEAKPPP